MAEYSDTLDRIDRRILAALAGNARLSMPALADAVGLSKTPVVARLKRLEAEGYIRGYHAALDTDRMGLAQVAFVQVTLSNTTALALEAFNAAIRDAREVEACHMIAGGFDYLLKIRTRDMSDFNLLHGKMLIALPGVRQTRTFFVMKEVIDNAPLDF